MNISREDALILAELQKMGRMTNVDLANKVGLSESPCLRKTKCLEDEGVIKGYQAVVDAKKVGFPISAYVLVHLDQRSETDTHKFFAATEADAQIIECQAITGPSDLILKVVARDVDDLANLTMERILRFPSVKDISTCLILKQIKENAPLPTA